MWSARIVHNALQVVWLTVAAVALIGRAGWSADSWQVEVCETAGLERFKYPVTGTFKVDGAAGGESFFELRDDAGPVPAQFTRLSEPGTDDPALWSIDFHVDLAPRQTRELTIVCRSGGEDKRPKRGLSIERTRGQFHVRHPSLAFVVAEDLSGFLTGIDVAGEAWLADPAGGLRAKLRTGKSVPLVAPSGDERSGVRVIKSGPLAAQLEFTGRMSDEHGSGDWRVVLGFPLGKSWVRADCTLDDASDTVEAIEASARFRLTAVPRKPVLADVGANGWTYAALRNSETVAFQAGPRDVDAPRQAPDTWRVDRVIDQRIVPFVLPENTRDGPPPQGWAHLMDQTRCAAIAVDRFAEATRDSIELSADGTVLLRRAFQPESATAARAAPKRFAFWLHVVYSPPQFGAATSPQSMQMPPVVRIDPVAADRPSSNN